jgi:RES domain-containing protein
VTVIAMPVEPEEHLWVRVARPEWRDALDATHAGERGGRWNPAGSWPTLYLNRDLATARAQVTRLLAGTFAQPDDLSDDAFDVVAVRLAAGLVVGDVVSTAGVRAAGLPASYPLNANGSVVAHARCQLIGAQANHTGLQGIEARSACTRDGSGRELACWSGLDDAHPVGRRVPYGRWRSSDVDDVQALVGSS